MDNLREPVLCYVDGTWAYFTTQELDKQWGDDWDDAPYEHNASPPYEPYSPDDRWLIFKMAWEGPFIKPCDGYENSPYSVQDINARKVPWLKSEPGSGQDINIMAGTPLGEFIRQVKHAGGRIYVSF